MIVAPSHRWAMEAVRGFIPELELRDVVLVNTACDDFCNRVRGMTLSSDVVHLVEGYQGGQFARDAEDELRRRGVDLEKCGRVYT